MFNKPSRFASFMCAESFMAYLGLFIPVFHKISFPMLVMGGSRDGLISVKEFQETAKHYKAEFEIIEGGSHDLMLDDEYTKSSELIHQWINKL